MSSFSFVGCYAAFIANYRRFRIVSWSHLRGARGPFELWWCYGSLSRNVRNYQSTLRNMPEERIPHNVVFLVSLGKWENNVRHIRVKLALIVSLVTKTGPILLVWKKSDTTLKMRNCTCDTVLQSHGHYSVKNSYNRASPLKLSTSCDTFRFKTNNIWQL